MSVWFLGVAPSQLLEEKLTLWGSGQLGTGRERERDKNDQSALCDKGLFALLSGKGGL